MIKDKTLDKILSGLNDKNIRFSNLIKLLKKFNFNERIKGDHHIFTRSDVQEIINIQPRNDGKSKPYQIKQIRNILIKYNLSKEENSNE